jgi:hypothetical protein
MQQSCQRSAGEASFNLFKVAPRSLWLAERDQTV